MPSHTIDIQSTTNPTILKFEADIFLSRHDSYEFNNIEDAKPSPLAQQLFHLPFVKTVYIAQNFIAIQKYDIVDWTDVQEDVRTQLLDYLESGKPVVTEDSKPKKKAVPVTVYAESTPNPAVLKFVANKKLVIQSEEFKSIDDAASSPLAQALFHFPFVKEIFIDENYVSIQKYDMATWEDITTELRDFISNHIKDGKPIVTEHKTASKSSEAKPGASAKISTEGLDDISKAIVEILDEYVKPAVASDGGNIVFESYDAESKSVRVILQGACSGCPSSTMTLKNGIEAMLQDMLKGKVDTVVAVNG